MEKELIENLLKVGRYNKMYRVNFNGLRLYVQEKPFAYYSGLTGALSACTFKGDPDERRLTGWRNSMIDSFGEKNAKDYVDMTAQFGTLLHAALVTIKNNGCINWDENRDQANDEFYKAGMTDLRTLKKMVFEYQKHVASLMQFVYERVERIDAIETPAKWEAFKIATPIDFFCSCRQTEKGKFYPTTINIKTASAINNHHFEQVACELAMWNETYSDKAEYAGILRTKDWTKEPSYEFKSMQSDVAGILSDKAAAHLRLCLNSPASYYPSPEYKTFSGVTKIGDKPEIITRTLQNEWES